MNIRQLSLAETKQVSGGYYDGSYTNESVFAGNMQVIADYISETYNTKDWYTVANTDPRMNAVLNMMINMFANAGLSRATANEIAKNTKAG